MLCRTLGVCPYVFRYDCFAGQQLTASTQNWLDDKTAPSGALAKCKVCNGLLTLLIELNGDLPEQFPGHDRRLYIWSCRRKTCRRKAGSVRGLRGVRVAKGASSKTSIKAEKEEVTQEEKPQRKIGESLFGVTNGSQHTAAPANPFSNPFSSSSAANPFASSKPTVPSPAEREEDKAITTLPETFASKVRLSSPPPSVSVQPPRPHEPWPEASSLPPPYSHYQLDADYETLDVPSVPQIPANARIDLDAEGSGSGGGKEDTDVFESSLDKMFQKFADRLGQNPEQVLRYEFRGKPLLYSNADPVGKLLAPHSEKGPSSNVKITTTSSRGGAGMPRCQNCGAERVFELQLTPHAIIELEADEMSIDGMEWGTIIMGVCSNDCKPNDVSEGEVGYLEEWIGVQWEEVASKR
jgi:pre-rRNA-processing protein TSR4